MNVRFTLALLIVTALSGGAALDPNSADAQDDQWISLFDGETLNGWKPNESPESWAVKDGQIVTQGNTSHLFYTGDVANHDFKNFEFSADVMTTHGSNSGIYVHTKFQDSGWPAAGYELQVINSNNGGGGYAEHKMTGSIYAIRNNWHAPVADGEWFNYRILVSGKTIQTYVNDELICEYTEADSPYRPSDKPGRLLSSGTFAIQAHDPGSVVHYRNLKVRLLPDDAPSLSEPMADRELDELITQLSNDNFALIDLGLAAEGEQQTALAAQARSLGVTLGRAYDGGMNVSGSVVILDDSENAITAEMLTAAKATGAKIAFTSGGATVLDADKLKARLQAIRAARLRTGDLWIPGK